MNEEQVLKEMIAFVERRIAELPNGESKYYKNMKESLEWEIQALKEQE